MDTNTEYDIDKLTDSPYLLDLLISMEDILDSLDIYVYKNWSKGEIIEGPNVRRYWLDFTLKYNYKEMPDPRAVRRLLKNGILVSFTEAKDDYITQSQGSEEDIKEDQEKHKFWLVKITFPRRLITEMNAAELDFYDDQIDAEDVTDAKDTNMNEVTDEEQDQNEEQAKF